MRNWIEIYCCSAGIDGLDQTAMRRALAMLVGDREVDMHRLVKEGLIALDPFAAEMHIEDHDPDKTPPPLIAAVIGAENLSLSELEQWSNLNAALERAPIVVFFGLTGLGRTRDTLHQIERTHIDPKRQLVLWRDVSVQGRHICHPTWPAEVPIGDRNIVEVQASSERSSDPEELREPSRTIRRDLVLTLDVEWAGEAPARKSAFKLSKARSESSDNDRNDPVRKSLGKCLKAWLEAHEQNRVVVTESKIELDTLHTDLRSVLGARDDGRVQWKLESSPVPLISPLTELPPEVIAKTTADLDGIASADPSADRDDEEEPMKNADKMALEGHRILVEGQLQSLRLMDPPTERSIEDISLQAGNELGGIIQALKERTSDRLRFGEPAKAIIGHIGPRRDVLEPDNFKTVLGRFRSGRSTGTDLTFLLDLTEPGRKEISLRLSEVMSGLCRAQAEILRLYWLRYIRTQLTEQVERIGGHPKDAPRLPIFEPSLAGLTWCDDEQIRRTTTWPKAQKSPSALNWKMIFAELRKIMRFVPAVLGMVLGVKVASGKEGMELGEILENPVVLGIGGAVLVFFLFNAYMTIRAARSDKEFSYIQDLEAAVNAKLTELSDLWFSHLDAERAQFQVLLSSQIRLQTSAAVHAAMRSHEDIKAQLAAEKRDLAEAIKEHNKERGERTKLRAKSASDLLALVKELVSNSGFKARR